MLILPFHKACDKVNKTGEFVLAGLKYASGRNVYLYEELYYFNKVLQTI